jgi:hypothetical protein
VEVAARLGADEGDEVARVVELAADAIAAGQVAAQRHEALHAHGLELGQLRTHAVLGGADAREVRSRAHALGQDLAHGAEGARLRGAARAVGDRAELGPLRVELLAHGAQLAGALRRLGREEFETDREAHAALLA